MTSNYDDYFNLKFNNPFGASNTITPSSDTSHNYVSISDIDQVTGYF